MNRTALSLVLGLASVAAFAQQPAAPAATSDSQPKPVVIVNGDIITDQKLDQLYSEMGAQMREQYEKNGGKRAFLDNYLRKRLIVQEAIKHGFDKRPDIQAEVEEAKEAALFQAYIREEIASSVVTEADIKKYYEDNKANFATPEAINVRHLHNRRWGRSPPRTSARHSDAESAHRRRAARIGRQHSGPADEVARPSRAL